MELARLKNSDLKYYEMSHDGKMKKAAEAQENCKQIFPKKVK